MASLLGDLNEIAAHYRLDFATLTRASGIVYAAFFSQRDTGRPPPSPQDAAREAFHICALPKNGAQAMLEWCPPELKREGVDAWGPLRQDFALMQRVKHAFDPQNVLSTGTFRGRNLIS
jgi:hypothetical protein